MRLLEDIITQIRPGLALCRDPPTKFDPENKKTSVYALVPLKGDEPSQSKQQEEEEEAVRDYKSGRNLVEKPKRNLQGEKKVDSRDVV